MPRVDYEAGFWRSLKKLDPPQQALVRDAIKEFVGDDPPRPSKKKGALSGVHTINVTSDLRVFLRKEKDEKGIIYVAFRVGGHDHYRKMQRSGRRGRGH